MSKDKSRKSFYGPIIRALRKFGGEAEKQEVIARIVEERKFTDADMREIYKKSGFGVIDNTIGWARNGLVIAGYLLPPAESSKRGNWKLSAIGRVVQWNESKSQEVEDLISRSSRAKVKQQRKSNGKGTESAAPEFESFQLPVDLVKRALLQKLMSLSSEEFESVCRRLLDAAGFEKVQVTKQTRGEKEGFDGHALLAYTKGALVKMRVAFECKRYKLGNPVRKDTVLKLLGAMKSQSSQEAERGIVFTTSHFSPDAVQEAEANAPKIELVGGDALAELFIEKELGVKLVLALDEEFFAQFKDKK